MASESSFYKCCSNLFATWLRVRILLVFVIILTIIEIALSAWLMQMNQGDMTMVNAAGSPIDWAKDFCGGIPIKLLVPFSFTYSEGDFKSSKSSYCGWSPTNSIFRLIVSIFAIITLMLLFFKTSFSYIARTWIIILTILYFTIFVLDAAANYIGLTSCTSNFQGTVFYRSDITINCDSSYYSMHVFFDIFTSSSLLLLQASWGNCKNLYNEFTAFGTV